MPPAPAVVHEPFAPRPLAGPFGSLDEFCRTVDTPAAADDEDRLRCDPTPVGPTLERAPPFRHVAFFPTYQEGGVPVTECNLALDAGNGWYVAREAFDCHRTHLNGEEDVSVASMKVQRFAGDHDLVIHLSDADGSTGFVRTRESLIVCAIGASGSPSCTPEIPTVTYADIEDRVVLDVRAEPGAIEITVPPGALLDEETPDEWKPLAGRHALVFP